MRTAASWSRLAAAALVAAVVVAVAAAPDALVERLRAGVAGAAAAEPAWLWLAAALFAGTLACAGLAWRTSLRGCGAALSPADACARYATGSLVNSVTPARLGAAVRIALFARALDGDSRLLRAGGAGAAVGAARAIWTAALVGGAAAIGHLPAWPAAVAALAAGAAVGAAALAGRLRGRARILSVLEAFGALRRSPALAARLVAWTAGAAACRLAAAAAVGQAVGLGRPLVVAVLVVAAVDVAAVLPVTPGNLGVSAAAIALVLSSAGMPAGPSLAAGIAFSAVETLTSLAVGSLAALSLVDLSGRRRGVAFATAAAGCLAVAAAFGATVLLPAV